MTATEPPQPIGAEARGDLVRLAVAALLRTMGVGMSGALLLVTLAAADLDDGQGLAVLASGLVGSATALGLAARWADAFGRRRSLVLASLLLAAGGTALAAWPVFPLAALAAFVGLVNGMGRDRGPALALEQAVLPSVTTDQGRTRVFARWHVLLDAGHALGALAAYLPGALVLLLGLGRPEALRWVLGALGPLGLASALLYRGLSARVEVPAPQVRRRLSPGSRRVIGRLSSLFALDSLGGGFLPNALLGLWFFRRFGLDEGAVGLLLAAGRVANMLSYLAAARLAARIGLIRTMVFTHVPSSLLLLLLPVVPSAPWAVALYLARELLVEMDLPTRQSYTMAVVAPAERTAAAGITGLVRAAAWALGAWVASAVVPRLGLSAPLVIGAAIKVVYDLLLYGSMRSTPPPEERRQGRN